MEHIEEKKENIKSQFMKFMLENEWTETDITEFISTFSLYILNVNRDYKYNQTYLTSYCKGFYQLKNYIREREEIVKWMQGAFRELYNKKNMKYSVEVNGLWEITYAQEKTIENTIEWSEKKSFSGKVDKNKLLDDKFFILIKIYDIKNHMSCYEFVISDISVQENKDYIQREVKKIIKQMKKMEKYV